MLQISNVSWTLFEIEEYLRTIAASNIERVGEHHMINTSHRLGVIAAYFLPAQYFIFEFRSRYGLACMKGRATNDYSTER